MHVDRITKILAEIFFNEDFDINVLKSLNQNEKDIVTDYISECRVESYVLKSIGPIGAKNLGHKNHLKLKNNAAIRTVRTLENIRFSHKISSELSTRKIKHIFLKGINMHKHIYQNNHEIRPISDIDILIKKENLIEVLKVSEDLGFDIAKWKTIKKEGLEIYRNPNPFHKNGLAQLDIHTTIKGSMYQDKVDFELFTQNLILSEKYHCDLEDLLINCLFHGTRQSNYNVGPIFIIDFWHFFQHENMNWGSVSKKIKKYGLETELNFILKYFNNKIDLPTELNKYQKSCGINESVLNKVFLAKPKNSSIFSVYSLNGLQILLKKFFSKKYIKDHSFQKFTFVDFCNNFLHLVRKNLAPKNKLEGEILVSKERFKILRTK